MQCKVSVDELVHKSRYQRGEELLIESMIRPSGEFCIRDRCSRPQHVHDKEGRGP